MSRGSLRLSWVWLCALSLSVAACDGGPNGPAPTPVPAPPQITCSSSVTVENITQLSQEVSYSAPSVTGGAAPVATTCSPASGSLFPLGDTTVHCTANDATGHQATCSFVVAVHHRQLPFTRYLAFGDSITAGENGRPDGFGTFIDIANAYPTFLQQYFTERIPGQQISVINAGKPGEKAANNDARLKDEMARTHAEVLLLLEGINDLNDGASPQALSNVLRDSIRTAKDRGAQYVFVSTILPVAPENCDGRVSCRAKFTPPDAITSANTAIRSMVPANGGVLVDSYDIINANRQAYIDLDGLHLRPEGNRALATAFWDAVVRALPPTLLRGF